MYMHTHTYIYTRTRKQRVFMDGAQRLTGISGGFHGTTQGVEEERRVICVVFRDGVGERINVVDEKQRTLTTFGLYDNFWDLIWDFV